MGSAKLRDEAFELPADGEVLDLDGTGEVSRLSAAGEQSTAFRGILYERRGEEELKTTFTAMRTSEV
ncbi:MAG: hypothetical protein M3R46_01140 [Actinomycetota bacterium]|nr:hypothetical protein [Actinomycetota bacterium]